MLAVEAAGQAVVQPAHRLLLQQPARALMRGASRRIMSRALSCDASCMGWIHLFSRASAMPCLMPRVDRGRPQLRGVKHGSRGVGIHPARCPGCIGAGEGTKGQGERGNDLGEKERMAASPASDTGKAP